MNFQPEWYKKALMDSSGNDSSRVYQGKALIADPIYSYAFFTVPTPGTAGEVTEKDLIDTPWLQRLRRIYQLQSARWVYPSAEHTRFQHSLGTMHNAGEFARHLYPSLKNICADAPSLPFVEELLRLGGLLHDVGHGPYGHFFDDHYLSRYGLTHEDLGGLIITRRLGRMITRIRRSPDGPFDEGERLNPGDVAFLIKRPSRADGRKPRWLRFLRQLFSGIYTVDNLDYVQRDAYMTGFSLDMVDMARLRFYTFFTEKGLTLHKAGVTALSRFVNARLNLYTNVYFHRTTRALDLHLQEVFSDTLDLLLTGSPADDLDGYLDCDEWRLFQEVRSWQGCGDRKKERLARQWQRFYNRELKWKMAYSTEIPVDRLPRGTQFSSAAHFEERIRSLLPKPLRGLSFRVDLATQDPRPINPMAESERRILIFDPVTGQTSAEPLREIYRFIPARVVHFRVFALNHAHDRSFSAAAEKALELIEEASSTNV